MDRSDSRRAVGLLQRGKAQGGMGIPCCALRGAMPAVWGSGGSVWGMAPLPCSAVSHRHSWRCFGCSSAVDPSSEGSSGFSLRERDLLTHRCVPMVAESRGVGSELFNTRHLVWVRKAACSSAQLCCALWLEARICAWLCFGGGGEKRNNMACWWFVSWGKSRGI